MEKSWNFKIGAKSHFKFPSMSPKCKWFPAIQSMEKSWNFVMKISWQPCLSFFGLWEIWDSEVDFSSKNMPQTSV